MLSGCWHGDCLAHSLARAQILVLLSKMGREFGNRETVLVVVAFEAILVHSRRIVYEKGLRSVLTGTESCILWEVCTSYSGKQPERLKARVMHP